MTQRSDQSILRIGLPKGSLQDSTIDLFDRAGYEVKISSRSYYPQIDDPTIECVMFRSQEMSRYVEDGVIDMGITGYDWVLENGSSVHEVCELSYSKATSRPVRWVLAVPEESKVFKPEDLPAGAIVATELTHVVTNYFKERNLDVKVEFSWGATEVKARLIDGIVDVTETGSSLRANKLRVIDELLTSTTRMIANKQAWANPAKREKIENLALLLQGAIHARRMVGLKMNVQRDKLDSILAMLPSEQSPTVNALADDQWVAVEVIVDTKVERDLVPQLHRAGAHGVFSYDLNKVIS